MYKRLNKYLDRTLVGRLDFFRQLIFVTYAPVSYTHLTLPTTERV